MGIIGEKVVLLEREIKSMKLIRKMEKTKRRYLCSRLDGRRIAAHEYAAHKRYFHNDAIVGGGL